MYILQISDLHITSESDIDTLKNKVVLLCDKINNIKTSNDTQIVCCVLGDIVEQGNEKAFEKSIDVITILEKHLKQSFGDENVKMIFVPGNHDLCKDSAGDETLSKYHEFVSLFSTNGIGDDSSSPKIKAFGYSFLPITSVVKNNHKYGQISSDQLNYRVEPYTIMLTHHALISSDDKDDAAIRNGYSLLKFIEDNKIIALLHGHTHGCKRYSVGDEQQVIGVGPLFKNIEDISNQCNLIQIHGRYVRTISTLTYHADRKCWDIIETFKRSQDNNYAGNSITEVYSKILEDADVNYSLSNIRIEIKQKFCEFKKEIEDKYNDALKDAELWQKETPDESLGYTHSQLMNFDNKKWYDFVVDTLKTNPTSKRAIIPLIDKAMASKGGDGPLVSFDTIQFRFPNNTFDNLNITIYLRALELRYFLPVNICETYIMAQKLRETFTNITDITICLFACVGEAKDTYGCYRNSQLDILSESDVCKLFSDKRYDEIHELLCEKIEMSDTVINNDWLTKIKNAVESFCSTSQSESIITEIALVEDSLVKYKRAREICSNYFLTKKQEDRLKASISKLADSILGIKEE